MNSSSSRHPSVSRDNGKEVILKSRKFFPIGVNLTNFGINSDMSVKVWLLGDALLKTLTYSSTCPLNKITSVAWLLGWIDACVI